MMPAPRARWLDPRLLLWTACLVLLSLVTGCGGSAKKDDQPKDKLQIARGKNLAPRDLEAKFGGKERFAKDQAFAEAKRFMPEPPAKTESYDHFVENDFLLALKEPQSTFSIDVDTASYSNIRRFLTEGQLPPVDAVRVEEMVNYFTYDNPQPKNEHPIALTAEVSQCPWNTKHQLVRLNIQGKMISAEDMPPRNLVFLVDTSGSMQSDNRLPLLKRALLMLTKQLTFKDRVAIVAYAGYAGVVLEATPGDQHDKIQSAINSLNASGSTNGGEGIQLAYDIAKKNFIQGGANRVILGTDGDFNVGVTNRAELIRLIEEKRKTGVFLTCLGFGMGNYKDDTIQQLAQHGNGQYGYIDSLAEAKKVFVENIANLVPIAKDVKVQIEFNPKLVQAYRLIGYENRLLKNQDFNDDTKDAGDMGAGHTVTALYEIVPPGEKIDLPKTDDLKFLEKPKATPAADSNNLLTFKVRYIPPEETKSRLVEATVKNASGPIAESSADHRFAAAVAAFGMVLRDSKYKGGCDPRLHPATRAHRRPARLPRPARRVPAPGANGDTTQEIGMSAV